MEDYSEVVPAKENRLDITIDAAAQLDCMDKSEKHELKFYFKPFAKALAIHLLIELFGPLGMLLSRLIFGNILNENMFFIWKPFNVFFISITWLILLAGPVIILVYPEKEEALVGFIIGLSAILAIKVLLLSLKYGYYTKQTIHELETARIPPEKLKLGYILVAWYQIPEEIANREIEISLIRHSLSPDSLNFTFSAKDNEQLLEEDTNYNLREMASLCLNYANKPSSSKKFVKNLINVITIGYGLTPLVVRLVRGEDSFVADPIEICYMIAATALSGLEARRILSFLGTGIFDFYRKKKFMDYCYSLLTHDNSDEILFLDTTIAKNFLSWYYLRMIMLDFGKRFTVRMSLYMSIILIFSLSVVVLIVIQSFGIIGSTYNFYFASLIYLAILSIFVLLIIVLLAVDINNSLRVHIDVLLELSSENRRSRNPDDELNDTVSFVIDKMDSDSVLKPIKVLWVEANDGLVLQLGATFLSGALAVIQIYYAY